MMRRSEQEKAANRAAFQSLSPAAKAEHIWIYYKWFIILGIAALVIVGSVVYRVLTKKNPVVYMAWFNTVVGADLEQEIGPGFIRWKGLDPERNEVLVYRELYLAENDALDAHRAAYAAKIKLMAATEQKQLDLVLMSQEAWNILSEGGYLLDLQKSFSLPPALAACLSENRVILEDNTIEYELNEADELIIRTEPARNALEVSGLPMFRAAGFSEPLYLGIIANSPRQDVCMDYFQYLLEPVPGE